MKVRTSQIPEESGKVKRIKSKSDKVKAGLDGNFFDDDSDYEEEDSYNTKDDDEEEEEVKYIKTMVNIPEIGSIALSDIGTIEKDFRIVESNYGGDLIKTEYGITINKGMEPSIRYPRVNISVWHSDEDLMNQRYERMLKVLKKAGFKFINV